MDGLLADQQHVTYPSMVATEIDLCAKQAVQRSAVPTSSRAGCLPSCLKRQASGRVRLGLKSLLKWSSRTDQAGNDRVRAMVERFCLGLSGARAGNQLVLPE